MVERNLTPKLAIENRTDRISIYGSIDITRDQAGRTASHFHLRGKNSLHSAAAPLRFTLLHYAWPAPAPERAERIAFSARFACQAEHSNAASLPAVCGSRRAFNQVCELSWVLPYSSTIPWLFLQG